MWLPFNRRSWQQMHCFFTVTLMAWIDSVSLTSSGHSAHLSLAGWLRSILCLFLTLHDVLAFSCPVPGRVILGKQYWIHVIRSDVKIFRKLSSTRAFDDSLFLLDFDSILFYYLFCIALAWFFSGFQFNTRLFTCSMLDFHDTIFWIIHGKDSFISFWWYTWRHLYLF
jgi:hypothetical protein